MTTVWELCYGSRRSRYYLRNSARHGPDPSVDDRSSRSNNSNSNSNRHHTTHTRRQRRDPDGCNPLRRSSPLPRHPSDRPAPFAPLQEHESGQLNQGGGSSASGSIINLENFGSADNRLNFRGNNGLPGAVLLARDRLLQRLRGVSVSGRGQSNRASSGVHNLEDHFRLVNSGDLETEISSEWQAEIMHLTDPISPVDQRLLLQETRKRSPGLTQDALDCLCVEVFIHKDISEGSTSSKVMQECSICLETFLDGDELIYLPCGHKFHHRCLYPWVQTCGDCPYCRSSIVVDSGKSIRGR